MISPLCRRIVPIALLSAACAATEAEQDALSSPPCDPDSGGITLESGFCAMVVADVGQRVRHIAVRSNGDIVAAVATRRNNPDAAGGVYILRDTTGDGRVDVQSRFGESNGGTGLHIVGDQLWFGYDDAIVKFTLPERALEPTSGPDTIVRGLPSDRSHAAKSIAIGADGRLFVNIGSPSNACQREDRQPQVPGLDPCPELDTRAGIWVFDANRVGQTQRDGERFATGIRNAVAIGFDPDGRLYVVQHGRDNLSSNWGYSEQASAEKPAEELFVVDEGDDFGWPYCYFDPESNRKVLAPEYGGDGEEVGRCADKEDPVFAFPAHWAPNDLLFYTGSEFPARYREGLFVAFHGSWNRAPLPQGGYNVVFLPFNAGAPLANFAVFADGFAGDTIQPGEADHRPTGLAQGPDGSLYIASDQNGRIWRVTYEGE